MKLPDLGSSGPHQTPMPATEPTLPFPLQAPSLYTTSHPISSTERERFLILETTTEGFQSFVDPSAFETSVGGTPMAKNSASSKVVNFLYLAFGNPLTCSSQSDLLTFNWTRIFKWQVHTKLGIRRPSSQYERHNNPLSFFLRAYTTQWIVLDGL